MAPNFLSKFVKSSSSDHHRSRTNSSARSSTSFITNSTPSSIVAKPAIAVSLAPNTRQSGYSSDSSSPNVTVIPPSPHTSDVSFDHHGDGSTNGKPNQSTASARRAHSLSVGHAPRTPTAESPTEEDPMTPTPWNLSGQPDRSTTTRVLSSSNSTSDLRAQHEQGSVTRAHTVAVPPIPQEQSNSRNRTISQKSSRSALRVKVENMVSAVTNQERAGVPPPLIVSPSEITSSPEPKPDSATITISPIVDSPTNITAPNTDFGPLKSNITPSATMPNVPSSSLLGLPDQSDAASVYSVGGTKKRRPWGRKEKESTVPALTTSSTFSSITSTSPKSKRKPTAAGGLASALAASGLAMANPTAIMQPIIVPEPSRTARSNSTISNPKSGGHSVVSPSSHKRRSSNDRASKTSPRASRSRQTSISYATSDVSDRVSFYSGDDDDMVSGSEDDSDDLDLDADIPVTGFAVASARRNQEFHEMFGNIPEGDYLIEDYGCALQREILIQGRLYISENHVCFHANLFGWITDLTIPMHEVSQLEKRMTAFVIPNAIQITTRTAKYTFTSFLSRDTTFDVMYNVWRLARPEGDSISAITSPSILDGEVSPADVNGIAANGKPNGANGAAPRVNKVTSCACGKAGQHYSEVAMESILPGTPEKIYNLMFTSGFIKDFMRVDQKLIDIQISDWMPLPDNAAMLTRNMSYIKPLNASIGPKQTKCELRDEMAYCDFDEYVAMLTTTRTPDVPSGGVFSVKTRTCITWASSISTKVYVSTQVEWTGRSFIKGIIEKSCIDGQKTYHAELESAMRAYIHEHQSEFIPADVDIAAVEEAEAQVEVAKSAAAESTVTQEEARKNREKERNRRGLQWAYDTFEGAFGVAKQSTEGAIELLRDAWDQSSMNTILYFVIVILVISNIWTLAMMGQREEVGRRKELKRTEEREKWVQGIVTALWDELSLKKVPIAGVPSAVNPNGATDWREEVAELTAALDIVEARIDRLRQSIPSVESLT
ncbi:hypothetical protein QCA50_002401 [Cerrena zonata]|uniref:VASt domain-containing protein n=1 Tax=Cerrena zonata TaxID=2478898 RepID=A0AAW0GP12_9APHY